MTNFIHIIVTISRLSIGSLFIVSGLIKTNDALGFSYKLVDYFGEGVLNMEFLIPYALPLAMFICIIEVILGIAVIFGLKSRLVTWSILLMMLFFTWLTWYTSSCLDEQVLAAEMGNEFSKNCVSDCGCFGDALKLIPKESYHKDLILMVFTLIIFIFNRRIKMNTAKEDIQLSVVSIVLILAFSVGVIGWWFPVIFSVIVYGIIILLKRKSQHKHLDWIIAGITALVTTAYTMHCYLHLPVKDFRPYKVDASIEEGMTIPPDAQEAEYEITWYFNENGKEVTYVTDGQYPKSPGKYVKRTTKIVQEAYEPPIHDFTIELNGNDYVNEVLAEDKVLFIVAYDLAISDENGWKGVKEKSDEAKQKGYRVVGLTSSGDTQIKAISSKYQLDFPFYFSDGTALKTIIRSNPGLMTLNKGIVKQKVHHNDAEDLSL